MKGKSYRLLQETRALRFVGGQPDIFSIPAGDLIAEAGDGSQEDFMISVFWKGTIALMLIDDLERRGVPVTDG